MTNSPFAKSIKTVKEPQAIVSVWKSSEKRRATQGVLYHNNTGTGHKEVLGTIVDTDSLTYKGHKLPNEYLVDASVSVRVSEDDFEHLIDAISDFQERLFQMKLTVTEVVLKTLTVNGEQVNNITFFASIQAVEKVQASLSGDSFEDVEGIKEFLAFNQKSTRDRRDESIMASRTPMNDAAAAGAPEEEPALEMG